MAALAGIKGTVSLALDGFPDRQVARFEVPVTTTLDRARGIATIEAASFESVLAAAAQALKDAADQLLAGVPAADVVPSALDSRDADEGQLATCGTCGQQVGSNVSATLEHNSDGSHTFTAAGI